MSISTPGLDEREVRRAEAHVEVVALEEGAAELRERALQVGEADALVDQQALDLVEHRRVRLVVVPAIHAARAIMRTGGVCDFM